MGRVIMGNRELLNSGEEAKECLITLDRTVEPESEIEALLSELEVLRRENEELRQLASEVHEVRDLPSEEVRVLVREYALGVPKDVPIFRGVRPVSESCCCGGGDGGSLQGGVPFMSESQVISRPREGTRVEGVERAIVSCRKPVSKPLKIRQTDEHHAFQYTLRGNVIFTVEKSYLRQKDE